MIVPIIAAALGTSAPVPPNGMLLACFWPQNPKVEQLDGFAIFLPDGWTSGTFDPTNLHDPAGFLKGGGFERVTKQRSTVKFSSGENTLTVTPKGGELFSAILVSSRQSREGTCQTGKAGDREAAFSFFDGLRAHINDAPERGQ